MKSPLSWLLKNVQDHWIWAKFDRDMAKIKKLWNCENMENTLKIKVFRKSILFCEYLRNGSSDLYEILCGGQFLSCELKFQISWRSVCKCARTRWKRAHSRYNVRAHVYNSCTRIYAWILMKFETWAHKIKIDHHIKFHNDPSYRCGDICKTISTFWIL